MRKLAIALVTLVYAVPITAIWALHKAMTQGTAEDGALAILLVPILLMVLVVLLAAANLIGALLSLARGHGLSLRFVMGLKLGLIPFYLVNFACWGIGAMVFHTSFLVIPLLPIIIAYTYCTMLGTSVHSIARLILYRRDKKITTKQLVLHGVLQCMFVLDVVVGVVLAAKQKKLDA